MAVRYERAHDICRGCPVWQRTLEARGGPHLNVARVIEILARYDPDLRVYVADGQAQYLATALDVQVVEAPGPDGGLAICVSPHSYTSARQVRPEVKCPKCAWVHIAIPRHHAEQAVLDANSEHRHAGRPAAETTERYLRCFRCGQSTLAFTLAGPDDAPDGCTLQPVVVGEDIWRAR